MDPDSLDTAPDPRGRATAAERRAVVLAGHRNDPETARAGMGHDDPVVRAAALTALARCADLRPEELRAAASDPDATVRRRVATVAARLSASDPRSSETTLLALLGDDDPTVVEVTAFALGELSDATEERIGRLSEVATTHDDPLCRESAVAALGSIGDEAGRDAVLAACRDRATVRRRAVLALAAFDGPEVTAVLRELTGDRDLQVSQAAEDLLGIETGEPT
ncbi:MAG: HEAT repeat domain-containing protein [Microthrixaceae bacterium]|nr:HEAT repeat domain-containing protein [Microthrixaceae bacterium]